MVTAESLACGTPVVGFCAGAPEQITIPEYSEFVPYGDLAALTEAVNTQFGKKYVKAAISRVAAEKYSKEKMTEDYYAVYMRLLEEKQGEKHESK